MGQGNASFNQVFVAPGTPAGTPVRVARPGRVPAWFTKMDRNGDGDVSRREFLGTEEEFKMLDADGDGLISPEEAEKADRLYRKRKR
jgi:hypothetical protein